MASAEISEGDTLVVGVGTRGLDALHDERAKIDVLQVQLEPAASEPAMKRRSFTESCKAFTVAPDRGEERALVFVELAGRFVEE